jgi:hypothetical protein
MSRLLLPVAFVACLALVVGLPTAPATAAAPPAKAEEELVDRVRKAMDNGVRYLKKQQSPQGNWEGILLDFVVEMKGGSTALVTLALLNCGVSPKDPAVAKALDYLRELPPNKTYVVGLCNLVFAEAREPRDVPLIQKNADWLIENALGWKGTGKIEGWSYPQNKMADNSNTQYALLGLYAAKQAGAKIPDKVWEAIQDYYTRHLVTESPTSGYWTYYNERGVGSISMTVAGVCGLLIAAMGLDQSEQKLNPATGVAENCGLYSVNTPVAKGMGWVANHFNFVSPKSTFYNIYGIERLGRLSGQRFIGSHDWYREGCEFLVGKWDTTRKEWVGGMQDPLEGWISNAKGETIDGARVLTTSFALLFLSKGRTPVLLTKFAWGGFAARGDGLVEVPPRNGPQPPEGGSNWNRKHNDTRHVVEFCSKDIFNNVPLSWQVYDARRRKFDSDAARGGLSREEKIREEVGYLLQSPVLYITGHGPIFLEDSQEEILKLYVEEGGFLVAEACCGDPVFAKSFKALMKKLFPDNKFEQMPGEHIILRILPGLQPTDFPEVEVMSRGCRTAAVFSPVPLAGFWEESKYMPKDSRRPQNKGEKAFCLARNIVAYATGMELPKPKLSSQKIFAKASDDAATRSKFKALQLQSQGETEPAPDALRNLMGYLRDNARLEVATNTAVMRPHNEDIAGFKFMYMHGRRPLDWGSKELATVKSNLQTGGLLLADAACSGYEQWQAYDKSFREMCAMMFPENKLEVIQPTAEDGKEDPLFKIAREAGINIKTVRCRRELAGEKRAEPEMKDYPVLLEGIKIKGRWVIVYSKYDIGCAIEGHKAADCLGHDKDSALRIAAAVTLYSLKR